LLVNLGCCVYCFPMALHWSHGRIYRVIVGCVRKN
jgi:hypothetical protein